MKIIVHPSYGGFHCPAELRSKFTPDSIDYGYFWSVEEEEMFRTNPEAVAWVETHDCDLRVAEIPEQATDYEITEYDGAEDIIYVMDGRICHY